MKLRGGLGLVCALGVALIFNSWAEEKPKTPETPEAALLANADGFKIIFESLKDARFKILRVDSSKQYYEDGPGRPLKTGPEYIDGWKILATRMLTQEHLGEVQSLLVNPQSYQNAFAGCFDPGMALVLTDEKPENRLVLLICLRCHRLQVFTAKKEYAFSLSKSGNNALLSIYNQYFAVAAAK